MKIDELINEKNLIVADNKIKNSLLEELSQRNKLHDLKFINMKEFIDRMTFTYDKKTIYYIYQKYHYKPDNIRTILDNMKYVINDNPNPKIHQLYQLKQELIENDLLQFDKMFSYFIKQYKVIFISIEVNKFILSQLDNYKIIDTNQKTNKNNINIYEFNTINDEVEYVFNEISTLIKKGVSINNIKLTNISSEYHEILYRFSKMYQINVNLPSNSSIYGTPIVKIFLENLNLTKQEIIELLKPYQTTYIYQKIMDVINEYYFIEELHLVKELIINDLKLISTKSTKYTNAVEIIDLEPILVNDNMHIFMLSFNTEAIPKIVKDEDYFSDKEKNELGLNTSVITNEINIKKAINFINNINNLTITYKLKTPFNKYFPSNLIEEISCNIVKDTTLINQTSDLYNKIKLTSNLDNLIKYGESSNTLSDLYQTYQDLPYLSYDNQFSGIDSQELKEFINKKVTLSYTNINEYSGCSFKYYINYILKLNPYEDKFNQFIGNLYHYLLSKAFYPDFHFDEEFNNYLIKRPLNPSETFFINILKEELIQAIDTITRQHQLSNFKKHSYEKRINFEYDGEIKLIVTGIIDKIMYYINDHYTLVSVIDYKTGFLNTNIKNMKYGLDMQLPFYLYLINKVSNIKNVIVVGIYLQKILHEEVIIDKKKTYEEIKKEHLKLVGYSLDNEEYLNLFDPTYKSSELIKGMKISNDGHFYHYTKLLTTNDSNLIKDYIEKLVIDTFQSIINASFKINPKVLGKTITCQNCEFQDLCFVKEKDYIYLEEVEDFKFLGGE